MDYPSITTVVTGIVIFATFFGLDWLVWGRTWTSDFWRQPNQISRAHREGEMFKHAA